MRDTHPDRLLPEVDRIGLPRHVVKGQWIDPDKKWFTRELRKRMTPAEAMLWQRVRRNQIGGCQFRRQQLVRGYIADFYCHAARLVVELDGGVHAWQAEHDRERDEVLRGQGFTVLRFSNDEVLTDIDRVVASIRSVVLSAQGASHDDHP